MAAPPKTETEPALTAETLGQALPPATAFIVMQCNEVVVAWAILQDGKAFRGDAEHHPPGDAYASYLNWLNSAHQIDVYQLPCPDKQ